MHISKQQARRFLLSYHNLSPPRQLRGKAGILDYIRRVGCIQFDPLDIVGRNPELVLQARVGDFRSHLLNELLYEDRKLLDGWDKNMAIYAVEDWPYFRRWRESVRNNSTRSRAAIQSVLEQVRAAITERGPLSSHELGLGELVEWDWAHSSLARAALESMYFWGELVIHHRVHTRKVYDFAHRLLPQELLLTPDPNERDEDYHDWHVLRRIGSVGLIWNRAGEAWLGMSPIQSKERKVALERLLEQGRIEQVRVEGVQEPFYIRSQDKAHLVETLDIDDPPAQAIVIAPLDNLLWDRRMLKAIFGFEYTWEVYVPPAKRRFGYYVLPVLYGDRFIARFEPGQEKKNARLIIKNWWWEPNAIPTEQVKSDLVHCFQKFIGYLGANRLELDQQAHHQADLDWLNKVRATG